ncbi:MAG: sigma-70 family RNA polymerase sigma factor [Acetatifactor sp.]|nr:sigma-70 family RNA polymerase sigma factor [Acetatifactor sp.]
MDDNKIVELYWERREEAIRETSLKYGGLCTHIARNILSSYEDSEECVNDTYFAVWNAIPNERPNRFSAFVSRITRNLALKRYEYISASKRNPAAITSLEELGDCVSGTESVESEVETKRIETTITKFLWHQSEEKRNVFIRRYWYFDSIENICKSTGFTQSKVKSMLYEMRQKLRKYLESEGIEL